LDKEEDEGMISFKISKTFSFAMPSIHNFLPNTSLVVDIAEVLKQKEQTLK
jgi:hypothetical protein